MQSEGSNLLLGIKMRKINEKLSKTYEIYWVFYSKLLVFESNLLESQVNHSWHSSLLSNERDLNHSQLLFNMSDFEQKSEEQKIEFPSLVMGPKIKISL